LTGILKVFLQAFNFDYICCAENKMDQGVVSSVAQSMEISVPSNKETGPYSMPSATNNPDASGPSFSEALKSKKPPLQYDTLESADGGPGGKGAKKKAKKGKQIDPSLLGFKVHSNRIMMGEILRDD
jgi:PERQ amino acid-rich with GYF domain-containing protein